MMSILRKVSGIYQGTLKDTLEGIDVTVSPVPFSVQLIEVVAAILRQS